VTASNLVVRKQHAAFSGSGQKLNGRAVGS
jgi:hypothetical protein